MSDQSCLSPQETLEKIEEISEAKGRRPLKKVFLAAILAGLYVAFGGLLATLALVGTTASIPFGWARIVSGMAFSLGLILVVIGGAELFTGSTMLIIPFVKHDLKWKRLLLNWLVVYAGNFVGSIILAASLVFMKTASSAGWNFGLTMMSSAATKLHHGFFEALLLGVFCNILVCLAIFLAASAKNLSGKILGIIFPVAAFVALGFEHSVANMYLVPMGIFTYWSNPGMALTAHVDASVLTWGNFIFSNLIPVTIGNIIGGALLWLVYLRLYKK